MINGKWKMRNRSIMETLHFPFIISIYHLPFVFHHLLSTPLPLYPLKLADEVR